MKKGLFAILFLLMTAGAGYSHGAVPYIFNLPTFQTTGAGILLFDVGHRYFDPISHSTNVNVSFSYGITEWLDIGVARSFLNMDSVGTLKLRILDDYADKPDFISLSLLGGGAYKEDTDKVLQNQKDKSSAFGQVIIQKHLFSNRVSLGAVPTYGFHTNFYNVEAKKNFSAGSGFFLEIYFLDRVSVCGEVVMNFYGFAFKYMNYNAGLKYAGYRHTFSLWIGNSPGYSPVEYMVGNTTLAPKVSGAFTREFDIL